MSKVSSYQSLPRDVAIIGFGCTSSSSLPRTGATDSFGIAEQPPRIRTTAATLLQRKRGMENRDRDKVSRNTGPTPAGDINRETSENIGKIRSDSDAEFGQNIGRAENPESEPSRRNES
jgi:hypothetical protein